MTESQAYIEVAERSLIGADGALEKTIHEKAAFLGYHAFESTGGAFCRSRGITYPISHRRKINTFVASARLERYATQVAQLAVEYASLRNIVLYPVSLQNGTIQRPLQVITSAQTKRLLGRTSALVSKVKPTI